APQLESVAHIRVGTPNLDARCPTGSSSYRLVGGSIPGVHRKQRPVHLDAAALLRAVRGLESLDDGAGKIGGPDVLQGRTRDASRGKPHGNRLRRPCLGILPASLPRVWARELSCSVDGAWATCGRLDE